MLRKPQPRALYVGCAPPCGTRARPSEAVLREKGVESSHTGAVALSRACPKETLGGAEMKAGFFSLFVPNQGPQTTYTAGLRA